MHAELFWLSLLQLPTLVYPRNIQLFGIEPLAKECNKTPYNVCCAKAERVYTDAVFSGLVAGDFVETFRAQGSFSGCEGPQYSNATAEFRGSITLRSPGIVGLICGARIQPHAPDEAAVIPETEQQVFSGVDDKP